ncbi:alpha-mannosidase [Cellulomonas sp. S1-8]|uniref:alpha-mannosidase n=1 Tax=Cellulomonas sp. S1-8 TaxID=2904790 RepID=UPI002242FE0A|nr:alpha-mannosidase [Cellulomonas sp. S1-8]UZN03075.1 alpha-mannosidase [Cellulomonas sp. S1-8]
MSDLKVDRSAVEDFVLMTSESTTVVGAECVATAQVLGSGRVQDALGNVSLVLTVLDQALAGGASELARDARSSVEVWVTTDTGMAMQ